MSPELDALLEDPLLGEAPGFESFLCLKEDTPQVSESGPSPASSFDQQSDQSTLACTTSELRPTGFEWRPANTSPGQNGELSLAMRSARG